MSASTQVFDAVLVVSFGGPQGLDDIRPFLANVLRGRRVTPQRVEDVVKHYEHFGGVSPITELTRVQAEGLRLRLASAGHPLPVYVGMRNWDPLLSDTLRDMSAAGVRRAIVFIAAAQHSFSSCEQYRQNVASARAAVRAAGQRDVDVTYVGSWFDHDLFIEVNAKHVLAAVAQLSAPNQQRARLLFTAHSVPLRMAEASRYREQLQTGAARVAARAGIKDWAIVYQSRSGRPEDPWLEPDVCDYLRNARAGLPAVVLCPLGFVSDHIEVLWDLDQEAAAVCRELNIEMTRAEAPNADPVFIDMMTDVVLRTVRRYEHGRPLDLVGREPEGTVGERVISQG